MSDPGLTIDQRGLRTTGGRLRTYLPDDLVARYEPLHNLNVSAGQADLVVARDRANGEEVVVKLYRNAEQLDREVMERLYGADNSHVVRLIDHGETDGEPWEVQEYCSLGTLTDYRLEQGGHLSESQALAAVKELADAIHHIHGLHITHRDLKPENILVRALEPLDLVLTDFGVAAEQIATVQLQTVAASWVWAAPEVHTKGAVSRDIDWWAMGAIVHQLLTGRHPLSGSDGRLPGDLKVIRAGVVDGLYSTGAVVNERWRNLVDGLLSYEPTQRWGYEQVSAWLTGQNPDVVRTMPVAQQLRAAKHTMHEETREHLFVWNGAAIRTGLELVQAMRAEWQAATKLLDKWPDRPLRDWLMTRPDGQVLAQVMDREANGDGRLIRLQARFDPDGPLEFMGRAVNDESMNQAIKAAERWSPESGGEAGEAHTWLSAIRDRYILRAIAAAVESDSQRLIRADQLLNNWQQSALGFLSTTRKHVQVDQSGRAAAAAEVRFSELLGFQFAVALSGEIPTEHGDRSRALAARIRSTLNALGEHELLPKSSPWANKQRARSTVLDVATQVTNSTDGDLGLHIPASIYLDLMDQVCSHDLTALRDEAERLRREREARERAEREARERAEREAREQAARAAREAIERAEAEKKRLEEATRSARAGARKWWDERLVIEAQAMQAAEDKRSEEAVSRKRDELERHSATYHREKSKDTNGGALAVWLVLSACAVIALIYAFNRWGGDAVIWAFVLSGIFLGGGLFWGLYPLQAAFEELTKGTPAKRKFLEQKAEVDKAIAGLAPRQIRLVRIPVEKVGLVIGKGGETINCIAKAGVTVDIQGWHEVAPPSWGRSFSYGTRATTDASADVRIQKEKWESGGASGRPWLKPKKPNGGFPRSSWTWKSAYWTYVGKDFLNDETWWRYHRDSDDLDEDYAYAEDDGHASSRFDSGADDYGMRQVTRYSRYGHDDEVDVSEFWDWFEDLAPLPPAPVPPKGTEHGENRRKWNVAFREAAEDYQRIKSQYERVHRGPRKGHGGIVVAVVTAGSSAAARAAVEGIDRAMSGAADARQPLRDAQPAKQSISVGNEYTSSVKTIVPFGAFVELVPGVDGLLDISEMKPLNANKRVERVEYVLRVGQVIEVKVAEVKPGNKYSLRLVT